MVTHENVLSCNDYYSTLNPIEYAAVEARRLLFVLLCDKSRSPLLHLIYSRGAVAWEDLPLAQLQNLSRALLSITSSSCSLQMRQFILYCLNGTPQILPLYFKSLSVVDPKPNFSCIACYAFIAQLIREGPTVVECWSAHRGHVLSNFGSTDNKKIPDSIMACIMPSGLSKHVLTKALLQPNALLVSETLKLMQAILQRCEALIQDVSSHPDSESFILAVADAFQKRIPDVQPLLTLRSKFDPFATKPNNEGAYTSQVCLILTMQLYDIVCLYSTCLPRAIASSKVDLVTKLLPQEGAFLLSPPPLQLRVLETLKKLASFSSVSVQLIR